MASKKQILILFGPPGAGKGTQSELLAEKLSLYYFETSKILEENFTRADIDKESFVEVEGKRYGILDEKKIWEEGKLCDPPFVTYLVEERIKKLSQEDKNIIIAGSPRTLYEAERLVPFIENLYGKDNIKTVLIEISPEQTIFRNSHRRICELMRHPILYNKETESLEFCPLDGSKLNRREGLDDPETIKVRLKEYKERTFPVFDYFEKQGFSIKKVNGDQSVADVFKDILEVAGE